MTNLILLAVGNKYIETLIKDYHKIPSDFSVTIYTSDVVKIKSNIKNANVFEYPSKTFKYFDKFKFTIELSNKLKETVLYIDTGRLKEVTDDIWFMDLSKVENISFASNWGGIESSQDLRTFESPYFESNYFDNILDYFIDNKVELKDIPVFLERIFVVPFKKSMSFLLDELEIIRELFEENSKTKENVYSGLGNGEGLGMGYALTKLKEPYSDIKKYKRKVNKVI